MPGGRVEGMRCQGGGWRVGGARGRVGGSGLFQCAVITCQLDLCTCIAGSRIIG